jgi:transcriptional regulator with XRE-family HTH domain
MISHSHQEEQDEPATAAGSVGLAGTHSGPTVQRIALGAQLRRLREASNVTAGEAAMAIRATHSKISRLERGRTAARPRDVADLLSLYGITDQAEREKLLALSREASTPGWWRQYNDVLPRWLELYVGLEKAASVIRTYEVQFINGLMQTEDYVRAVVRISRSRASAAEIDRRVSLRMERQRLLTQPGAPELWTVLDEAALRRPPCSPAMMHAQLRYLLELTDLANVTLQIVPFRIGPHAASGGPFTILRFPEPEVPDVVYLEQLTSALYLEQPDDVTEYLAVMNELCVQAATAAESKDILRALLREQAP